MDVVMMRSKMSQPTYHPRSEQSQLKDASMTPPLGLHDIDLCSSYGLDFLCTDFPITPREAHSRHYFILTCIEHSNELFLIFKIMRQRHGSTSLITYNIVAAVEIEGT
ncbi:hypothetical protein V6N13_094124 [Hibiscus sabdariffa]|uniref:Uncharacterized protein n=2 Tax=Hibiscus sabdariffa TaxID=183260 RepID=A0ABR2BM51_9ROSI